MYAGKCVTSGYSNIALGQQALGDNTVTGNYNVAMGYYAGYKNAGGSCNVSIGYRAGQGLCSGTHNVFLGFCNAVNGSANGTGNVVIGCKAGLQMASASNNIIIGEATACLGSMSGGGNILMGYETAKCITSGGVNVLLGYSAGRCITTGCYNIYLGMNAGEVANGQDNIAIGCFAGCLITGCSNVVIGREAGRSITSGDSNVVIGYDVEPASATGDSQFIIGCGTNKWICGDSSYNIYDKDGNQLNGASGGGGDKFNTGITSSVQATIYGYETSVLTLASDDTKRYTIESISVGNVTAGVGSTVNVIASINPGDTTYSSETKVYLAYNIPVPDNGLVELIKQPIVMNPDDVLKVWATNENNQGINDALELYASYAEHESTDFVAGYGSTVSVATTALTDVYTSTGVPTVVQSIKLTNRTDSGDFPVTIQIVNADGSATTHLAKNLVIPRYASVELLDRPKRLETGSVVKMQTITAANTIDVVVSGKKIT